MTQKSLLVVESPSKARTIEQYLDGEYEVIACVGHVKDLPSKELGVDIENDFTMTLTVLPDRKQFIQELQRKSKNAARVLIATDPDREGEAIAAHLASEIPPDKLERVEFTEITKTGIKEGMENVRGLNDNLVRAQQTRRIIDRLVGYKVSPVLWATLQKNMNFVENPLSAGRVQSAGVKIIVDRDRKRQQFKQYTYFDLKAILQKQEDTLSFEAILVRLNETRITSGKDFDPTTGELTKSDSILLSESQAKQLVKELESGAWTVSNIEEKPRTSRPRPPFTTSTLQQESARKLRLSARRTMRLAQQLYENGFITYMRTDSTHLSAEAIAGARQVITNLFGDDYLPKKANHYQTKVKNAQEAHEAVRPAHREFRTIEDVRSTLGEDAAKLYDLIWKRTVACQMLPAKLKQTRVMIQNQKSEFRANGKIIIFPGYMRIYVEGHDNPEADLADKERILPELEKNDSLSCTSLKSQTHTTKPPARFTEASLVKDMEANGIGRPSTFASILDAIVFRGYVHRKKGKLSPAFLGVAVTQLLENHFTTLVSREFTAKMEDGLDEISRGEREATPFMKKFYYGGERFTGLEKMLEEKVDIPEACTINLPDVLDEATEGRIGRYGPFLRRNDETRSIPENLYLGDLTTDTIEDIFKDTVEDKPLGLDPETNQDIWIKKGPYGHYVQLGDTKMRKAIPKGTPLNEVNQDFALQLLALPRTIGIHPETGIPITADYGRYGPYIKMEKSNGRLIGEITPLNVTLEQAIEILKKSAKGSSDVRKLGNHPETGEELILKDGRYGPYVTDGKVNASLKNDHKPETFTLDEAIELINAKRTAPKRPRRKRKK
ncbi:MAG: type I DNA topoisomerase [Candidatus Neomarinimicrobiota bacterium]|nr:type I DNA topoisomerase [Candidatus Neomarinimicrobiota bacterium]